MIRTLARPAIIVPHRGVQRPLWPFALNRDSGQAEGLKRWYAWPLGAKFISGFTNQTQVIDLANTAWNTPGGTGNTSIGLYNYDYRYPVNGEQPDFMMGLVQKFGAGSEGIYCGKETGDLIETFPFTLSCWLYPTAYVSLMGVCNKAVTSPYAYGLRVSGSDWISYINSSSLSFQGPALNQWAHIAVVVYSGFHGVYLNGSLIASVSVSDPPAANDDEFLIGTDYTPGSRPFNGSIVDFRIYKKALSAAEVWRLYDPRTRWDLYYPLRQRVIYIPETAQPYTEYGGMFTPMTGF
jgi:hypothetical protein